MYVVKFERYWNDYRRKDETKTFLGLAELENWMFGQMQQDYTKDFVMTFPTPAAAVRIKADGPWAIEFRPKWELTLDKFLRGLVQAIEDGVPVAIDAGSGSIDPSEVDADGADMIIQYALFEEVVFG